MLRGWTLHVRPLLGPPPPPQAPGVLTPAPGAAGPSLPLAPSIPASHREAASRWPGTPSFLSCSYLFVLGPPRWCTGITPGRTRGTTRGARDRTGSAAARQVPARSAASAAWLSLQRALPVPLGVSQTPRSSSWGCSGTRSRSWTCPPRLDRARAHSRLAVRHAACPPTRTDCGFTAPPGLTPCSTIHPPRPPSRAPGAQPGWLWTRWSLTANTTAGANSPGLQMWNPPLSVAGLLAHCPPRTRAQACPLSVDNLPTPCWFPGRSKVPVGPRNPHRTLGPRSLRPPSALRNVKLAWRPATVQRAGACLECSRPQLDSPHHREAPSPPGVIPEHHRRPSPSPHTGGLHSTCLSGGHTCCGVRVSRPVVPAALEGPNLPSKPRAPAALATPLVPKCRLLKKEASGAQQGGRLPGTRLIGFNAGIP
ncbi:rho GTPase-activating protein 17-like isoform X3 [Sorex araneus]|uniref:rho GTPase-activating protein 17-like isoform X3 n=1 Tax=Sorex araneus TaxID=42254 RepID=UPI002433A78E|nr:rho GTPase-activating protein 17-like isoform X3 [Sorex araneus]